MRARRASPDGGVVKSARRALEVLELFAETHRPATVMEIARRLGYPQSSTSVLLAGLARLGYLELDVATRAYRPTLRVLLLGAWQQEALLGDTQLLPLMEELRRRSGCSVLLGLRRGVHVQYILALRPPDRALDPGLRAGVLRPVCRAAVGKALLLGLSEATVARLARHANAQERDPALRVEVAALVEELRAARGCGWTESGGAVQPGLGVVAVPLPALQGHPPLGLGLGGRLETVGARRAELVALLREAAGALLAAQGP